MTKTEFKQIEEINTFFKDSKITLEKIRKNEANNFINTPKSFVKKGADYDTNACLLADTISFLDECVEHLAEITNDKG